MYTSGIVSYMKKPELQIVFKPMRAHLYFYADAFELHYLTMCSFFGCPTTITELGGLFPLVLSKNDISHGLVCFAEFQELLRTEVRMRLK